MMNKTTSFTSKTLRSVFLIIIVTAVLCIPVSAFAKKGKPQTPPGTSSTSLPFIEFLDDDTNLYKEHGKAVYDLNDNNEVTLYEWLAVTVTESEFSNYFTDVTSDFDTTATYSALGIGYEADGTNVLSASSETDQTIFEFETKQNAKSTSRINAGWTDEFNWKNIKYSYSDNNQTQTADYSEVSILVYQILKDVTLCLDEGNPHNDNDGTYITLYAGMYIVGFNDPGSVDGDHDDLIIALQATSPVGANETPIPGTALLLGTGLIGLVSFRRRIQ